MQQIRPRDRVIGVVVYAVVLLIAQYIFVEQSIPPTIAKGLWFYNGIASLLLGSRLLNPHFTPPGDAATNAFVSLVTIISALQDAGLTTPDAILLRTVGILCGLVMIASIAVLILRPPVGQESPLWVVAVERAARWWGSPTSIFTIVILVAAWVFHRQDVIQVFVILSLWSVIVAFSPVENFLAYIAHMRALGRPKIATEVVGLVAAHQSPGIVLIRQSDDSSVARGSLLLVTDDRGPRCLAVAVNYVGRDEGNLLRAITVAAPKELGSLLDEVASRIGLGVAVQLHLSEEQQRAIPQSHPANIIQRINQFCGIVDQDSSLEFLQFEVIEDRDLSEGSLVEVAIANRPVLYQVLDGVTREEIVQQKNKYGYARAKARKIGAWNAAAAMFEPVSWLPSINTPVFLRAGERPAVSAQFVGHFPNTAYGVAVNTSDSVTHNTAILGILGIGKSFLAIELVERMIADGIKVVCFDLTDQYAHALSDFFDPASDAAKQAALQQTGGRGRPHQNKEQGGTRNAFKAKALEQLRDFSRRDNPRLLRIYNPAQFDVWQQTGGMYNNNAAMASLTACEITTIITEAALEVAQEHGTTDRARICVVFEEAHTLIPEWNSVATEGDRAATAATARAILQGRKYGLGCLLITQRTANVTKTILNQCNSIFAMRTFDDTGKEFLSNYIGSEYAKVLPSIEARHAVFFGKASSCEDPVLIRLNDREGFLAAFRREHPPAPLIA